MRAVKRRIDEDQKINRIASSIQRSVEVVRIDQIEQTLLEGGVVTITSVEVNHNIGWHLTDIDIFKKKLGGL